MTQSQIQSRYSWALCKVDELFHARHIDCPVCCQEADHDSVHAECAEVRNVFLEDVEFSVGVEKVTGPRPHEDEDLAEGEVMKYILKRTKGTKEKEKKEKKRRKQRKKEDKTKECTRDY
jgi:hypothetical protein